MENDGITLKMVVFANEILEGLEWRVHRDVGWIPIGFHNLIKTKQTLGKSGKKTTGIGILYDFMGF